MMELGRTQSPSQLSFGDGRALPSRTIHYLGGKARILPAISAAVKSVARGTRVCDLFSGSATVTRALLRDYDVIAVDVQEYARVIAAALTTPVDQRRPGSIP